MEFVRTPESRFAALPDFEYSPHYREIRTDGDAPLRVHYLDEGPRDGRVLLCLHGEPTWSYLYRKTIPHFAAAGYRTIAPDLVGFGKSDKPVHPQSYSYERHVEWLAAFLDALEIDEYVLVAQDWGGLLGLRLVADRPQRFAALVLANTFLPTGDEPVSEGFLRWRAASQRLPEPFPAGYVLKRTCTPPIDDAVASAYDAPFPDERYCAGARVFPLLVPTTPDDRSAESNRAAWRVLETFAAPVLCAFSDGDPITRGGDHVFRERIPGARGIEPETIAGASHFLQEDKPAEFAGAIVRFLQSTIDRSRVRASVVLAEMGEGDFIWMLDGGRRHDGLRCAPLSAQDREIMGHVREMTAGLTREHVFGSWMIVHDGEVVGACGFHGPADAEGEVEIGYNVFELRQRRGYMSSAVAALVSTALAEPAIRKLVANTSVANVPSQRVLERNAFVRGETSETLDDGPVIRWTRDVQPLSRAGAIV